VLAAYDWCLKTSHAFNVLDARGAISVSQRAGMILGIRKLACGIAARHVGTDALGGSGGRSVAAEAPPSSRSGLPDSLRQRAKDRPLA
jgi:hypothetical protein